MDQNSKLLNLGHNTFCYYDCPALKITLIDGKIKKIRVKWFGQIKVTNRRHKEEKWTTENVERRDRERLDR